jgi:heme exporter protein D
MGEFAAFIWSSYAAAFVVMAGMVIATILRLRRAQKRLAVLEEQTERLRQNDLTAKADSPAT